MDRLTIRLAGLGVALVITAALLFLTGLASGYIRDRTKALRRPPQEYIINLQPPLHQAP